MESAFRDLFEYNNAINVRMIEALSTAKDDGSIAKLFSHIVNAHAIWNGRITGTLSKLTVWQEHEHGSMASLNDDNHILTNKIISESGWDRIVAYTNSKGERFRNSKRDILLHVINHSTHHRGQVASKLKAVGIEPPVTDYIFFRRE